MDVLTEKEEQELLKGIEGSEIIEKEASISWDGRNLILRIPKEIADYLKLNEKNRFEKNIKFRIEEVKGIVKKEFDVIERIKPKRKINKNASTKKK